MDVKLKFDHTAATLRPLLVSSSQKVVQFVYRLICYSPFFDTLKFP